MMDPHFLSDVADSLQVGGVFRIAASIIAPILVWIAGVSAGWPSEWIAPVALLCALLGLWIATRSDRMSLSRAARLAYRTLLTTAWREFDEWAGPDEVLLDYVGAGIACEIPIFGKRSFLARYLLITVGAGLIKNGASAWIPFGKKSRRIQI